VQLGQQPKQAKQLARASVSTLPTAASTGQITQTKSEKHGTIPKMKLLTLFSSLLLGLAFAQPQFEGVGGDWIAKAINRTISLKIEITNGVLSGTLEGMGEPFTLSGRLVGTKAEGTATSQSGEAYFKIEVKGDVLTLTLANLNENNQPDLASGVTVQLDRDFGPKAQDAFQIAGFAAPPSDPLLASWKNPSLFVTIKGAGTNKYTGSIEINKQKATISATGNHMNLKGSFKLGKVTKFFSAKLENEKLKFVLDGKTQVLSKVR
jgi:hypothetical protein